MLVDEKSDAVWIFAGVETVRHRVGDADERQRVVEHRVRDPHSNLM
jgi:hypothetical protein